MSSALSTLDRLAVWDQLVVGPVRLEPDRLHMPYRVRRQGTEESFDLVYSYREPVFEEDSGAARNLASLIGAQAALNYGLFCRELVFRGPFDRRDRRFLEEMARNTAREIFVNKILQPNPFLTPEYQNMPLERPDDFLRANLVFDEPPPAPGRGAPPFWAAHRDRYLVLSSGGKESLLTYGLLHELEAETHCVFVNESGRHWYTALNAYRHFRDQVPGTGRVWTNVDRLFTWMLRRLPLIRPDFGKLRADAYPLRLWTVAVFLFGVLPLAHKRGVGRLLIGDEFDTTLRLNYRGIHHYGGLYDQSRFFDNALSRFWMRKGWSVAQFSLIRPLSELLVQKTLVERYPDLQLHQVSCHAAHLEGERAVPCGKCEKCRRVISMLVGLGQDPQRCGYRDSHVAAALDALSNLTLHQELPGMEHLLHLLVERGLLSARQARRSAARPRPEVLQLRFAPEASPPDVMPQDLRARVYPIFLQHCAGAVRRSGRLWLAFDPLSDEALAPPYRFEAPPLEPHASACDQPTDHLWGELRWPEAQRRLREVDIALLPVGSIEQHGPHLPLDVDSYDAERLCHDVAQRSGPPRPLVLPLVPYGVSYHHDDFPGTVSISPDTLAQLAYEIGLNVARQGITKLIIVNGHGGNGPALHFAAQKINRDTHIFTCVETGETSDNEIEALVTTPNDVHAGEVETSTTLHYRPQLVRPDLAQRSVPSFSSEYLQFSSKKGVGWYVRTARISPSGVLGDPTKASAELGAQLWEIMVRNLSQLVEDLKNLPLDEIHERRY